MLTGADTLAKGHGLCTCHSYDGEGWRLQALHGSEGFANVFFAGQL